MPAWRPGSTPPPATKKGTPVSWNSLFENAGPAWHRLQFPLPTKMRSPRNAGSG